MLQVTLFNWCYKFHNSNDVTSYMILLMFKVIWLNWCYKSHDSIVVTSHIIQLLLHVTQVTGCYSCYRLDYLVDVTIFCFYFSLDLFAMTQEAALAINMGSPFTGDGLRPVMPNLIRGNILKM